MSPDIAKPGENCWRIENAGRCALLIDGEDYFRALHRAIAGARRSIWILAWDIDSRLRLVRGNRTPDEPSELLELIKTCLERNPALEVRILCWDFSMIYALEREWPPLFNGNWRSHGRLHFHMDDAHPLGGSQHQKLVVVDESLAFVGGIDPSKWRWDTSEHRPDNPERIDPDGKPYPPFHDMMLAVTGDVARALAELARYRWERATGEPIEPCPDAEGDPWPQDVEIDLEDIDVAIARTLPEHDDQPEAREIERLLCDAIGAASRCIYLESQYFTTARIADALTKRLESEQGPEIVLVLPERKDSWLERATMDVLRARLIRRLQEADAHDRFRVYYPHVAGLGESCVSVHAKLLIVDDHIFNLGSANLSNRSMGLDSECNLHIESRTPRVAGVIRSWRSRLLCEHLGCSSDDLEATLEACDDSLVAAIEQLGSEQRRLAPLDPSVSEELEQQVPRSAVLDPERPVDPDALIEQFIGPEVRRPAGGRIIGLSALILGLIALTLVWRFSPLGEWLSAERLESLAQGIADSDWAALAVLGVFVVGALAAVPVTLLIAATALILGPWLGLACSFLGALLSAGASYGIGQVLGRDLLRRLAGDRLNTLSRRLGGRGVLTVITVRIVPIAPFVIINLVAGASHIRFRDYLLGTALGMAPGIAGITLFAD
ncbi:MAG: VTT domain-containing protein, partial [Chromatiales bacterium]